MARLLPVYLMRGGPFWSEWCFQIRRPGYALIPLYIRSFTLLQSILTAAARLTGIIRRFDQERVSCGGTPPSLSLSRIPHYSSVFK